MPKILDELTWRGLLNNITNEEKLVKAIADKKAAYVGFDPSAKSLHLGNYVMIMLLRRLSEAGIKTYALVGGATGMIGDPSGKSSERNLLDSQTVIANKHAIMEQLKKYGRVEVLDNLDNFKDMSFLDFLRDVGKLININYMLEKDSIKTRLVNGLSYTEFSYTLLQAYDFLTYYHKYNIGIQAGGADQWGNITTGLEMIRKHYGEDASAVGLTINLLTNKEGKKFGKSEKGAIFLDPSLTSPYEMYQFLVTQPDSEVIKLLKALTMLTQDEIAAIEKEMQDQPWLRSAQKKLAEQVVLDIHGQTELDNAIRISQALFSGKLDSLSLDELRIATKNLPSIELAKNTSYSLVDVLVKGEVASSNRNARELISGGAVSVNNLKTDDVETKLSSETAYDQAFSIIKKGKHTYLICTFK